MSAPPGHDDRIAIVGMACRVPGAADVEAFWRNLVDGRESIETVTDHELRAAGVPEALLRDPRYVRAGGFLADVEGFDNELFGFPPREAAMLDPQHRALLECAWHALEHAGHGHVGRRLRVGVYAGVANSTYYHAHVRPSIETGDSALAYQALISGERDFAATRLAYFFDFDGPAVNVQTACSTSLVATHLACQALLAGECDLALAGGAAVRLPQRVGYLHEEGMILSRDGHCRAFDAEASGTVIGNGAGIVVLRRLADALADGDNVHAVILASAVNNDGARKVGYTAPGVEGQAGVVLEALTLAGVPASSLGYVEAHGTGTAVGDPIEVAALTEAFRRTASARGYCALGSAKSNIGHLDIAAGVVGLIKAALAVARGVIPPSLHFRSPNPAMLLETTPFYVPQTGRPWEGASRRAGVSSFGIGGTNAHVVLESAPGRSPSQVSRPWEVLCLSAKTPRALRALAAAVADCLAGPNAPALADVAFTLNTGRRPLVQRLAVVCADAGGAITALRAEDARAPGTTADAARERAEALATAWRSGQAIDWDAFYGDAPGRRVSLPLYPFERVRRWIDAPAPRGGAEPRVAAPEPAAYRATWTRAPGRARASPSAERWLIVGELEGLAARIAAGLEQEGASASRHDAQDRDLRASLRAARATRIVLLDPRYESVVALGQALIAERAAAADRVTVLAVTYEAHCVLGGEAGGAEARLVLGPLRVLPQEYPEIACRNIDLGGDTAPPEVLERLLAECLADDAGAVVAIRGAHRWCPAVEPMALEDAPAQVKDPLVYLIIGGAGRIGLALAQHLHESERARLVLVGRTPLPPPDEWEAAGEAVETLDIDGVAAEEDGATAERLAALAALRRDGAQLLYIAADASREEELRRAFAVAETAFGRVDVAIHAAAAPAGRTFTPFGELCPADARRHFAPKVDGVNALAATARGRQLRACVLMSSLAAVLGGLGFAAYAAANAYLDAVAEREDVVNATRWTSIAWDAWLSTTAGVPSAAELEAIAPAAGAAMFSRILAAAAGPRVLVSCTDLAERLARAAPALPRAQAEAAPGSARGAMARVCTEDVIAATWRELLGVEAVARDDDFYDLGGNSLLATQVASRLRRAFGIDLPVRVLFEETTVAGLAMRVDSMAGAKAAAGAFAP
jgi:polyketide synthase PksJ